MLIELMKYSLFVLQQDFLIMVEADFTSVNGIIYMSLTENKVNLHYDDLVEDVADIDIVSMNASNFIHVFSLLL